MDSVILTQIGDLMSETERSTLREVTVSMIVDLSQSIISLRCFKKSIPRRGCIVSATTKVHLYFLLSAGTLISILVYPSTVIEEPFAVDNETGVGLIRHPALYFDGRILTLSPVSKINLILFAPLLAVTSRTGGSAEATHIRRSSFPTVLVMNAMMQ